MYFFAIITSYLFFSIKIRITQNSSRATQSNYFKEQIVLDNVRNGLQSIDWVWTWTNMHINETLSMQIWLLRNRLIMISSSVKNIADNWPILSQIKMSIGVKIGNFLASFNVLIKVQSEIRWSDCFLSRLMLKNYDRVLL